MPKWLLIYVLFCFGFCCFLLFVFGFVFWVFFFALGGGWSEEQLYLIENY